MRTRAQAARDDALRRLTRVNRSLAVASLIGAGILTDVVANQALGHTRPVPTGTGAATRAASGPRAESSLEARRQTGAIKSAAAPKPVRHHASPAPVPYAPSSQPAQQQAPPPPAPAPAPVVVSGGS